MSSPNEPFQELVAPFSVADTARFEIYRQLADWASTASEGYMIDCAVTSARTVLQQLRFGVPKSADGAHPSLVAFFDAARAGNEL